MNRHKYLILLSILLILTTSACQESSEKDTNSASDAPNSITNSAEDMVNAVPEKRAEIDRGAKLYKRCATCHTLEKDGRHKVGPNLYGVFGARAAARNDFPRYSKAMKASDVNWTDENLKSYIKNPKSFLPGTGMTFVGVRNEADVDLLLEYMRQQMTE